MRDMVRESDSVSLDLVMVEWLDSVNLCGGVSIDEGAEEPARITSVGWLTSSTDDSVTLVSHIDRDGQSGYGAMVIPRGSVVKTSYLDAGWVEDDENSNDTLDW